MSELEEVSRKIEERLRNIRNKVLVLSGKGGVGKSTLTANLAAALAKDGLTVGVFDYDLHGPAIPRMLGVRTHGLRAMPFGVFPAKGVLGIRVISFGLLLDERTPVIWRGPLKFSALRELLSHVIWGELDYLLFDLPPGTGDEALNIAHLVPGISGAILVTIPSEVSRVAVRKAATFCAKVDIKLLGVIENMSYFCCPSCGSEIELFGSGAAEKIARDEGVPFLGKIPLDPRVARSMDAGEPAVVKYPDSPFAKEVIKIARAVRGILEQPG